MKSATVFAAEHTVATVCPLDCPDSCSLDVTVQEGRVTNIDGSHANPVTGGLHLREGPAVRRAPLRRRPSAVPSHSKGPKGQGAFTRVSWDAALAAIAERMDEARSRWGGESILPYSYGGSNGLLTQDTSDATLFRRLGASRLARTVCAAPTGAANMGALRQDGIGRLRGFPRSASSSCSGARIPRHPGSTSSPTCAKHSGVARS